MWFKKLQNYTVFFINIKFLPILPIFYIKHHFSLMFNVEIMEVFFFFFFNFRNEAVLHRMKNKVQYTAQTKISFSYSSVILRSVLPDSTYTM